MTEKKTVFNGNARKDLDVYAYSSCNLYLHKLFYLSTFLEIFRICDTRNIMVIFNCGFLNSCSQIYVEETKREINRIDLI